MARSPSGYSSDGNSQYHVSVTRVFVAGPWVCHMTRALPRCKSPRAGVITARLSWVNDVFDTHEECVAHALATAKEIASKAPLAVTGSKVMINYARDHSLKDGLDYIAVWQTGMFSGAHMGEAFKARAEKRDPVWQDLQPLRNEM